MRLRSLRLYCFALVAASFLALPHALLAHAILMRSNPEAHAAISGASLSIELHYNSRVDGARSKLTLTGPDGKDADLGRVSQPAADTLVSSASHLTPGEYQLHWIALAADGHISRGEIPFTVK
jgi:methionine-rich copper-binding protein CopC